MKGNNIVLRAAEGITFRCKEKNETIVIEDIHEVEKNDSEFNYKNPIIPQGFTYVKGEWKKGFTIRNIADGSDFVWVPAMWLEKDGTLDGKNFDQSFGRRNFKGEEFSRKEYHEDADLEMIAGIKKYGGFYISAYLASIENGKLVFKKGNMPWVNVSQIDAKGAAENYSAENSFIVTSLPCGSAYDSIFKWIIQTEGKKFEEVISDSSNWGNYFNSENSPRKVTATGSSEKWLAYNIYDLAGNCEEWSTEKNNSWFVVLRGGGCDFNGDQWPAAKRNYFVPVGKFYRTGFRVMLYVK